MIRDDNLDNIMRELLTPQMYTVITGLCSVVGEISSLRLEKGLSQADLASLCGLSEPRIRNIESLIKVPTIEELLTILYALGKTISIVELQ